MRRTVSPAALMNSDQAAMNPAMQPELQYNPRMGNDNAAVESQPMAVMYQADQRVRANLEQRRAGVQSAMEQEQIAGAIAMDTKKKEVNDGFTQVLSAVMEERGLGGNMATLAQYKAANPDMDNLLYKGRQLGTELLNNPNLA